MGLINENELTDGNHNFKKGSVYCVGIKKRCRTIDRHRIDLGYFPVETKCQDLKDRSIESINEFMKTVQGNRFEISLQNETVEIKGNMKIVKFGSSDIFNRERLEVIL